MNRLKLYLNIFQLQEYDSKRFLEWVRHHPNPAPLQGKKPLVWTGKAKILYGWSMVLFPLTYFLPWVSLVSGRLLLLPAEKLAIRRLKAAARKKIDQLKKDKGLRVIGVAGSYGKTSLKEILFTVLSGKFRVYRTPESYNTVQGVAKAIDLELNDRYEIFICEIGEYKPGDVREICEMTDPDMGVITGVNEQHGERMGDLISAIKTVFELADWVKNKNGIVWVNSGDRRIAEYVKGKNNFVLYGAEKFINPLEENTDGAIKIARYLEMDEKDISRQRKLIKPFRHRLEVRQNGNLMIIDDAYNSNPDGFAAAVKYLDSFPAPRTVITPGIIELGQETARIHKELGASMTGTVDNLILVGRNVRTENLETGFGKKAVYIEKLADWRSRVSSDRGTVLFENDLTDEY